MGDYILTKDGKLYHCNTSREAEELMHYGVKGMKWGVRRTAAQLGHFVSKKAKSAASSIRDKRAKKKAAKEEAEARKNHAKKSIKDMSTEELNERIKRLQLEKDYKKLLSDVEPASVSRGRNVVMDILEKSGKNVGSQLVTYVAGTAVNKAFAKYFDDDKIINPKLGQKDK